MVDATTYANTVDLIIANLEGGYFHPQMLKDGRVTDQRYAASGETMFGIDRANGPSGSPGWNDFWALIDNANAKDNWSWNYMGGALAGQLQDLAGQIMLPVYQDLSNKYLSPAAQALVESDARLLFNFVYGAWNGSFWFQGFANKINDAVSQGVTDTSQLTDIAVRARTDSGNSLISQGGAKIASLVTKIPASVSAPVQAAQAAVIAVKENPMLAVFGGLLLMMGGLLFAYYTVNEKEELQT